MPLANAIDITAGIPKSGVYRWVFPIRTVELFSDISIVVLVENCSKSSSATTSSSTWGHSMSLQSWHPNKITICRLANLLLFCPLTIEQQQQHYWCLCSKRLLYSSNLIQVFYLSNWIVCSTMVDIHRQRGDTSTLTQFRALWSHVWRLKV